jgi:hypothetical protein
MAVAITLASMGWSIWYESLAPYLRAERLGSVALVVLQVVAAFFGVGLGIAGLVRFLPSWLKIAVPGETNYFMAVSKLARQDSPALQRILADPNRRRRFALAGRLFLAVLLLPGLGWVPIGLGIVILAFQVLEPDRSLAPDWGLVVFGLACILAGGVQTLASRRSEGAFLEDERVAGE